MSHCSTFERSYSCPKTRKFSNSSYIGKFLSSDTKKINSYKSFQRFAFNRSRMQINPSYGKTLSTDAKTREMSAAAAQLTPLKILRNYRISNFSLRSRITELVVVFKIYHIFPRTTENLLRVVKLCRLNNMQETWMRGFFFLWNIGKKWSSLLCVTGNFQQLEKTM